MGHYPNHRRWGLAHGIVYEIDGIARRICLLASISEHDLEEAISHAAFACLVNLCREFSGQPRWAFSDRSDCSHICPSSEQLAYTQAHEGRPTGSPDRIAMSVYGDDTEAKKTVIGLIDDLGFDGLDAGPLAESWRQQPGSPAYCTELTAPELRRALDRAVKERLPILRELSLERLDAFGDGFLASLGTGKYTLGHTNKDVVEMYRSLESVAKV